MMYLFVYVPVAGRIAPARSSKVKLPLPPRPTCSNKFRMDSAYPILFKGKYNREAQVINGQTTSSSLDGILNYLFLP